MKFLDRTEEMSRLVRLSDAGRGGFVVLWGRRRIGKSELLKEWCKRVGGLYTVADRSAAAVQRANFASAIGSVFTGFDDVVYPNWKSLFDALGRSARAANWHGPLAIDEFPYWVEADESAPSVLQNWIDSEKSRGGVLLAVAGSSQHMMQGLVLDEDSPLYGRADEKIKLPPIGFPFIREALGIKDPLEAVKARAIWGGVPRYWVAAEHYGQSLDEAVDDLVLNPLGLFHEEPATLLQSEIPSAMSLKPYLDVIGSGVNRVSEIAGRLGLPATALSRPLARLQELGLAKREIPYGENERNSKKSLYKLADPFCGFWFKVVASRRSVFDFAPPSTRRALWRKLSDEIFAKTWEELARQYVTRSERLTAWSGDGDFWMPAGRWWHGEEPEIDVASFNGSKSKVLIGEAKWSSKPFSKNEIDRLASAFAKVEPPAGFPTEVTRVLFLSAVEKQTPKKVAGMPIVTAADLF